MSDIKNLLLAGSLGGIDTAIQKQNCPKSEKFLLSGVSWKKEVALAFFSCNSIQISVSPLGFLTREQ